jgi:hypothetical protein
MRRTRTHNHLITAPTDHQPATIAAAFAAWRTAKHAQQ